MALPYDRKFNVGRQSEQLYNEELHKMYETTRHILDVPENKHSVPEAKIDGALWLDREKNEMKRYVKATDSWITIFNKKFQIVDQITNILPPSDPVVGQLWLYNDVLMYFNGVEWKPVKALEQDGSQFNISIFENFLLVSPLLTSDKTSTEFTDKTNEEEVEDAVNGANKKDDTTDASGGSSDATVDESHIKLGKWSFETTESGSLYLKYDDKPVAKWNKSSDPSPTEINYDKLTVEEAEDLKRKYIQGKIDYTNDNKFILAPKWQIGDDVSYDELDLEKIKLKGESKMLVPNLSVDRIFLDSNIDFSYKEINKVCIAYPNQTLQEHRPSLIHVNPGKLTKITKKLIIIDRDNPKIMISAHDTEYYGFHDDSIYGDLLLPEAKQDDGGYIPMSDGIFLSKEQAQNYDYVLAVHYDFSWFKSTGVMKVLDNSDKTSSYYIQDYAGPITVFTNGYNLEETSFTEDNLSKVITINENTEHIEDVSMIHAVRREYGFVRKVDIQNRAIIKTLRPFTKPLLFLNGEALHPQLEDIEVDGNYIYAANGVVNMVWGVVELYDEFHKYDMNLDTGYVRNTDPISQKVIIKYDNTKVDEEDNIIVYIDGLLIKKEDVTRDHEKGYIYINGLAVGQDYILLRDKYNYFYDEDKLRPALPVGHLSESLVYVNGNLINNDTCVATVFSKEQMREQAVHNELKFFIKKNGDRTEGELCYYDDPKDEWIAVDTKVQQDIRTICYSYENTVRAIKFNVPVLKSDEVYIYAFNYANAIDETLIIRNIPSATGDDPNNPVYVENQKAFTIKDSYIPNIGSLSVWVNGLRQYDVEEYKDGNGFELAEPVTGVVTYVIENPENGATTVAQREILDEKNAVPNSINMYKTTKPMYPGRVLLYIDGVRQPQSSFTILDNYTLMLNDQKQMLTGNYNNFPDEKIIKTDGTVDTVHHEKADRLLVEVKWDYDRQENFIKLNPDTISDISISEYELPFEILEAGDEIMIFIDGLFFGLRKSFGYETDVNRGVISLGVRRDLEDSTQEKTQTNFDIIDRIINDPLYTYFEKNPDKKLEYENTHDGKSYEKKTRTVLFDWR